MIHKNLHLKNNKIFVRIIINKNKNIKKNKRMNKIKSIMEIIIKIIMRLIIINIRMK